MLTRLILLLELVEALRGGRCPSNADTVGLSQSDGKHQWLPENGSLGLYLLEVSDGSPCNVPHMSW